VKYNNNPELLRKELELIETDKLCIIDEIQKIPALLDEVHYLIEEKQRRFGLCGSSARKLKMGHANMLGGRAIRFELHGLSAFEIGEDFDFLKLLNFGYLPKHYLSNQPKRLVDAYIVDYLKEEIREEGLVRNLPVFSNFLKAAAFSDGEIVVYEKIASDIGISAVSVKEYFQILIDTLLGAYLPAFSGRTKRKTIRAPKFYFGNVSMVNNLLKRGTIELKTEMVGKAFENWVFHELSINNKYNELDQDFSYWRLTTGPEVDFVVNDAEYVIEAKCTTNITSHDFKNLLKFREEFPNVKKMIIVSCIDISRKYDNGIYVLNYRDFIKQLWSGELFLKQD
ncbi:MAG: AAA family ATPase, partial [Bdellovibrionales bacterium RIFOXYB2_FULL_36_6]